MSATDELRTLGYTVELVYESDGRDVYRVTGFGLATYVDDPEVLAALADPAAHGERARQFLDGPPALAVQAAAVNVDDIVAAIADAASFADAQKAIAALALAPAPDPLPVPPTLGGL